MFFHFIFLKPHVLGLRKLNVIVILEKKFSTMVIMLKCDNFDFLLMGVDVVAYLIYCHQILTTYQKYFMRQFFLT